MGVAPVTRPIERELHEYLGRLPEPEQLQVLEYAKELASKKPRGCRGADLVRFGGSIPKSDLELIKGSVEADCEQVDRGGW